MVACAALGKELREIIDHHGWDVDLRVINARLHNRPQLITGAVAEKLAETREGYDRQVVVYGHCGASDLDSLLKETGTVRPLGPHCYEMFGGEEFVRLMEEEPGTFFLTDFLGEILEKPGGAGTVARPTPRPQRDAVRELPTGGLSDPGRGGETPGQSPGDSRLAGTAPDHPGGRATDTWKSGWRR